MCRVALAPSFSGLVDEVVLAQIERLVTTGIEMGIRENAYKTK